MYGACCHALIIRLQLLQNKQHKCMYYVYASWFIMLFSYYKCVCMRIQSVGCMCVCELHRFTIINKCNNAIFLSFWWISFVISLLSSGVGRWGCNWSFEILFLHYVTLHSVRATIKRLP